MHSSRNPSNSCRCEGVHAHDMKGRGLNKEEAAESISDSLRDDDLETTLTNVRSRPDALGLRYESMSEPEIKQKWTQVERPMQLVGFQDRKKKVPVSQAVREWP